MEGAVVREKFVLRSATEIQRRPRLGRMPREVIEIAVRARRIEADSLAAFAAVRAQRLWSQAGLTDPCHGYVVDKKIVPYAGPADHRPLAREQPINGHA